MGTRLATRWLGRVPYAEALELQNKCVEARRSGASGDVLLLLEHPSVITLGRRGDETHLLRPAAELARDGIEVHRVTRGGDVTFHGPGQLVGYLILDLEERGTPDVHAYLREIEAGLIESLDALGVAAAARPGLTGVFMQNSLPPRKIASIGVGLRGWVSFHGFALNVSLDPADFAPIVPCGLRGIAMTSVARELGEGSGADLDARVRSCVAETFARRLA